MPRARVGEIELSYERSGSGPPLLAIMGMSGTLLSWGEPFVGPLRESFEVIAYDHRGVGESSRMEAPAVQEDPMTIAQLAQDAAGLLDALELDSAHVLGISMGGMVAQELALAHPERVRTLALGCTYCGGEGSSLASPAVAQRLVESLSSGDRALALRTGWEICISTRFRDDAELYDAYLARALQRPVARAVIMAQMQAIAAHDTSARLSGLQAPTLIVHGTADDLIPVQNARVLAGHLPGARLELLDGAGHLFFWEEPMRSAELVRDHASVHA
ncbi:MAG: alpha/beta fold hydrolase [Solirubrobacterales bacterium]